MALDGLMGQRVTTGSLRVMSGRAKLFVAVCINVDAHTRFSALNNTWSASFCLCTNLIVAGPCRFHGVCVMHL